MKHLANRMAGLTRGEDGQTAVPAATTRRATDEAEEDFFAPLMAPLADPRGWGEVFQRTLRKLVDEWRPTTFSEGAAVSSLAADYTQLARLQWMIERLQRPGALSEEDAKKLLVLDEACRDQALIRAVIARLDAGDPGACTPEQAKRLAALVATGAAQVEEDTIASDGAAEDLAIEAARERDDPRSAPTTGRSGDTGPADKGEPETREGAAALDPGAVSDRENGADEFEQQELEQLQHLWGLIRPVKKQLADREHLAAVLAGEVRARARETRGLRGMFAAIDECLSRRQWGSSRCALKQRAERLQHQALTAVAAAPEKLLLLYRLRVEVEKSIDRKLQGLRGRGAPPNMARGTAGAAAAGTPAVVRSARRHHSAAPGRSPRPTPKGR
jgi:hypothetical protein